MKIVKHYWFVAIALITMISFSSCESDEERGFDISGLYGKTWWGDMGFEDRYGEPLYSYITFTSGAFTGSPDKPGGLSIQLCKSEKKEFYIRYSS